MNPTIEAVRDLQALADVTIKGNLCGLFFPLFIQHIQADTGFEPTHEARKLARLIQHENHLRFVSAGEPLTSQEVRDRIECEISRLRGLGAA